MMSPLSLARQGLSELLFQPCPSHVFWMISDRVAGGSALCCTASSSASCPEFLKPLFDGFADPLAQLSQIACPEDASTMLELSKNSPSLTNCVEHAHLRASTPPTAVGRTILRNNLAYVAISRSFIPQDSLPCPNTLPSDVLASPSM